MQAEPSRLDRIEIAIAQLTEATTQNRAEIETQRLRTDNAFEILAQSQAECFRLIALNETRIAESNASIAESNASIARSEARIEENNAEIRRIWEYLLQQRPNGTS